MRIMVLHLKLKKPLAFFASVGLSDCSRYLVGFFVLKLNDELPLSTESIPGSCLYIVWSCVLKHKILWAKKLMVE